MALNFDKADVAGVDLEFSKRDVKADVAMLRPSRTPLVMLMMEKLGRHGCAIPSV